MRSPLELLGASFTVVKNNFSVYAAYSALIAVLSVIPLYQSGFNVWDPAMMGQFSRPGTFLAYIIVTLCTAAVGVMVLKSVADAGETTFKKSFDFMKEHYLAFLWVFILVYAATIIGFFLLIIPGILAMLFLPFAPFILLFEGQKGVAALKESIRYVKSAFGSVLWRFFALWVLMMIVNLGSTMFYMIGFLADAQVMMLLGSFISSLVYCLAAAYMYGMYVDIKSTLASAPVPVPPSDSPVSTGN